jgi:N-acetylneuraminic acid mutarotase
VWVVAALIATTTAGPLTAEAATKAPWSAAGANVVTRSFQTATTLNDGRVLVAGGRDRTFVRLASTELYNPAKKQWTAGPSLHGPRELHTATLLKDGRVLVTGGSNGNGALTSTELFDPVRNTWTVGPPMSYSRDDHTATLLVDGRVLVTGGWACLNSNCGISDNGEIFDPAGGTWNVVPGRMSVPRARQTAVRLADGRVLIAGGACDASPCSTFTVTNRADIFNPLTGQFSAVASLDVPLMYPTSTLLTDGSVLVAGGWTTTTGGSEFAERYFPAQDRWVPAASMQGMRSEPNAVRLPDGRVLVVGGQGSGKTERFAEIYDPAADKWASAGALKKSLLEGATTLLKDGSARNHCSKGPQPS